MRDEHETPPNHAELPPMNDQSLGFPNVGSALPGSLLDGNPPRVVRRRAFANSPSEGRDQHPESPICLGYVGQPSVGDVLLEPAFALLLQREQRRSDRSKQPLSLAVFELSDPTGIPTPAEYKLFDLLVTSKRETDTMGILAGGRLAVLLPDTARRGAELFRGKIEARAGTLEFASIVRSYPDRLFEQLIEAKTGEVRDPLRLDNSVPRTRIERALKRTLDLIGAAVAIALFSPVMLLAAVAIWFSSPGPAIFRQTRLGKGGVPFTFYKFRSMRYDAADTIHREHVTTIIRNQIAGADGAKAWAKLENDPRITRVGRFIRRTSIDELPQLFNVIQGHLSLVGPRPPVPYEAAEYQSWHLRRVLEVKPGITGLWQVGGRGASTFEDMVRLDLQYIQRWSLGLDLQILVKTVGVVLSRQGAK